MMSLTTHTLEQNPLSEQAINLPPKKRLRLLLETKHFPLATKRSSAKKQIEEMLDLYNLCCIMLARYLPDEKAEDNFIALNFLAAMQEPTLTLVNARLGRAFSILGEYEEWERRLTAIQQLFFEYRQAYPKLYEEYNLEDVVTEKISNIVRSTRDALRENPDLLFEVMERWKLN